MKHHLFRFLAVAVVLTVVGLAGCGPLGQSAKGTLTVSAGSDMLMRSVLPGISLEVASYDISLVGTSGQAVGFTANFALTEGSSQSFELLQGGYTATATAKNGDSIAIGSATASAEVTAGVPSTISLHCTPYTGAGTLNVDLEWFPNILVEPSVEVEMVDAASVSHAVTMTQDTSVHAAGTISLEQGWYVGFARVYDSAALATGVVRPVRLASGATTDWSELFEVTALEGQIVIDADFYGGLPLTVTSDIPEGDIYVYNGEVKTITCDVTDEDAGQPIVWAWYVNGAAVAVSTSPIFAIDAANFEAGTISYVSVIAMQGDGKRMGGLVFKVMRQDVTVTEADKTTLEGSVDIAAMYAANGWVDQSTGGDKLTFVTLFHIVSGTDTIVTNVLVTPANPVAVFTGLSADSDYFMRAYTITAGGDWNTALAREYWTSAGGDRLRTGAEMMTVPHSGMPAAKAHSFGQLLSNP